MRPQFIKLCIVLAMLSASGGYAQDYLIGEHTPLIFSGVDTIRGIAGPCTTRWMQVGFSPYSGDNRVVKLHNPEHFTLALKLSSVQGDTMQIAQAYFEQALDSSGVAFWNADSSNYFIRANAFNHSLYGTWVFEPLMNGSRYHLYPLRLFIGGYVRLLMETTVDDTLKLEWKLICEH